jgi:2-methylisocitrate lyase-like PEP mutase family enzyme
MPSSQVQRFRELHDSGCFVLPNPWDVGAAKYLAHLGFKALATTSGGYAFARGLPDGTVPLPEMLAHIREIVSATDLPVNADFGAGFGNSPEEVARSVAACVQTGVAGLSVEDATGNPSSPLYELDISLERLKAARAAIDDTGTGVLLVARAECFLVGHPDPLRESLKRLAAYATAGADVLYAPGASKPDDIRAIIDTVAPKPVNVLMSTDTGLSVSDLAALGVRRISVGSSMARAAWTGFLASATEIAEKGTFSAFGKLVPFSQLDRFFRGQNQS